jgi:hypothetical protein
VCVSGGERKREVSLPTFSFLLFRCLAVFAKTLGKRRMLKMWAIQFLTLFGREEAARPTVEALATVNVLFITSLVRYLSLSLSLSLSLCVCVCVCLLTLVRPSQAELKHRYISARDNRKNNGYFEYGIQYFVNGYSRPFPDPLAVERRPGCRAN